MGQEFYRGSIPEKAPELKGKLKRQGLSRPWRRSPEPVTADYTNSS